MVNERVTENIVRRHFAAFSDSITIEEQGSASSRIRKLLSTASKSGSGPGYPEFVISVRDQPDLLIVVECKFDPLRHQSATLTRYEDYAVDGVLLYASHLAKDFDVLAIAVSGASIETAQISHYLHLKTDLAATEAFGDKLLPVSDYVDGYLKSPGKLRQDYDALLSFTQSLNNRLHVDKISERNRALLVSAVLIALERPSFKNGYAYETDPGSLADMIVRAVNDQMQDAGITGNRLDVLNQKFGFISTETVLVSQPNELADIVREIDLEVNSFIQNHEFEDVLGRLYVEFLRYANSDKGLGIVLTPPHITELFADLAQVNENSVVYDNCAGTGGFLISAMRRMVRLAQGDKTLEERIKQSQLYGVELQSDIYPLAVSNMYIHQDGKSNINLGDCFHDDILKDIVSKKPTVSLLNPPYKADKQLDREELEFVLNGLSCIQQGGVCVAIVPMQCALATRGAVALLKDRLLANHTLECVLSMPDELFFNSKVGVVSCVMVFTARRPHPANKEVYFGYYKDDGFVKRKGKGRIDDLGTWDEIKARWLDHYINRTVTPGLSVKRVVTARSEWAAEAYMETDYAVVSDSFFIQTLRRYSTYLFANELTQQASNTPAAPLDSPIPLNPSEWQNFPLTDIFSISGTKTTPKLDLEPPYPGDRGNPYVTTQATDNGVAGFYQDYTEDGGVLTVDSAVVGYCAYQKLPFSASDHVEKLTPRFKMSDFVAMFLTTLINLEQYRYNYGRKCSQTRLRTATIKLPASDNGIPDWDYMEQYIKSLPYSANLQ